LQKAMQWDEQVYGLEYDLDLYMIVAVDDFNMGAMENKGLNVFNTKYVLANPQTATDDDYLGIESVIAHEYFHNWTGNRVTCRDWFQLSLKEGLTVFRDQQFSADMTSAAIQRIADVRILRNHQFPEDAGPMAHPVRPASFQEINNFYTATVYSKGAEVVRMIHVLLGVDSFRKGMDLYFQRHDGQAVTTDDFRSAMEDASGISLQRFQRWYQQSGTPRVDIKRNYDANNKSLEIVVTQIAGSTKGKPNRPFHMPMKIALFDQSGAAVALNNLENNGAGEYEQIIDICEPETRLSYQHIDAMPLLSAFRGFSAPVLLTTDADSDELARQMVCDSDEFNRWEAGQQMATRVMLQMLDAPADDWSQLIKPLLAAFSGLLAGDSDPALLAEMLVLPGEKYIAEMLDQVDVHRIREVRQACRLAIASEQHDWLNRLYQQCLVTKTYALDNESVARRRLKNTCLEFLLCLKSDAGFKLCQDQFDRADNMTDQMGCLRNIVNYDHPVSTQIVEQFFQQWEKTPLVIDKWFSAQGSSHVENALTQIRPLFDHRAYSLNNPNRARSLLGAMMANSAAFHQADGAGYCFAAEKILALDKINPQVAARMANPFLHWRKLVPELSQLMKQQIELMQQSEDLSNDLSELLSTSLAD
ncbi:MAG: aminopeptidase N, partial [Gammaproteobacteria bacterium]